MLFKHRRRADAKAFRAESELLCRDELRRGSPLPVGRVNLRAPASGYTNSGSAIVATNKDRPTIEPTYLHCAGSYFWPAAFFCSAQRRLTASAILLRPSGVRLRFFFLPGFLAEETDAAFFGVGAGFPASNARACCNCAISLSICTSISETPTAPPFGPTFDQELQFPLC
jgi:hypothetical protein